MESNGQEHEDTWCQRDPPGDDIDYNDDDVGEDDIEDADEEDDIEDADEDDDDDAHLQSPQTGLNLLPHANCTKVFSIPSVDLHVCYFSTNSIN